ncbi:MAG TPA: hypothetical protein VLZ05_27380 [Mycobacterium sp.]|nr:hypothetical protein [Mycobacterium sp.]HUH72251.1 hypothetical protein [Mycobacterium sp.]
MTTTPRSFLATVRDDASRLVERATKFSARIPRVGRKVSALPTDQLAFYGALGILAVFDVIDWPVALAIGVGEAVVVRHVNVRPAAQPEEAAPASEAQAVAPAPASEQEPEAPVPKKVAPKASA